MNAQTMELAELLAEANRQREQIPELADTDPFTERTFYYYVQQGLLPRASRRRGPGTTYPAEFVDRLLLIRRLQKEQGLTLSHIRDVLDSTAAETTIRRVARGVEPVSLRLMPEMDELELEGEDRGLSLRSRLFRRWKPEASADPVQEGSSFRRIVEEYDSDPEARAERMPLGGASVGDSGSDERRYPIGEDAWLVVDKELTPLQRKRLEQVVVLLRSILEEDD